MKIILAGPLEEPLSTVVLMKKALEELGQGIVPFDYRCERRKLGNKKMQARMIDLVRKENPDVFLLVKGEGIFPATLREIRQTCHVSLRYMDSPVPRWLVRLGREADSFFVTAGGLRDKYRRLGFNNVHHLWEGCDPEVHRYIESESSLYRCEVAFIGTNKAGREQLLRQVKKRGFRVKDMGLSLLAGRPSLSRGTPGQREFCPGLFGCRNRPWSQ